MKTTLPFERAPEPRWYAVVAVAVAVGLYVALPPGLTAGPRWLFPVISCLLVVPIVVFHRIGRHAIDRMLGLVLNSALTVQLIISLGLLIRALPSRREAPTSLLLSATSLWVVNILVFGLWYWRLDSGGPHGRDSRARHVEGAFLFPQMTLPIGDSEARPHGAWSPNFVDYLFLAFNTSTAFSPTDTPALARWAKLLMMLQSTISLTVLAVLAARAINIL